MTQIKFSQLLKMKHDGLVFYALTNDLEEFKNYINDELNNKGIGKGSFEDKFNGIYEIFTKEGRRDIVFEFCEKPAIAIGKLAIMKIQLNGLVSWISDYVIIHRDEFKKR